MPDNNVNLAKSSILLLGYFCSTNNCRREPSPGNNMKNLMLGVQPLPAGFHQNKVPPSSPRAPRPEIHSHHRMSLNKMQVQGACAQLVTVGGKLACFPDVWMHLVVSCVWPNEEPSGPLRQRLHHHLCILLLSCQNFGSAPICLSIFHPCSRIAITSNSPMLGLRPGNVQPSELHTLPLRGAGTEY